MNDERTVEFCFGDHFVVFKAIDLDAVDFVEGTSQTKFMLIDMTSQVLWRVVVGVSRQTWVPNWLNVLRDIW